MKPQDIHPNLKKLLVFVTRQATKAHTKSAFVISTTRKKSNEKVIIHPVRYTKYAICGAITIYDLKNALAIAKYLDGKVDYIFVDAEQKIPRLDNLVKKISSAVNKSQILTFKNNDLTADAADALIASLDNYDGKKIAIIGIGNIGGKLALKLVERGINVLAASSNYKKSSLMANAINTIKSKNCKGKVIPKNINTITKNVDLLIGFTPGTPIISSEMVTKLKKNSIIIDGGSGTILKDGIIEAKKRGIKILRLDTRCGFAASASLMFETENFLDKIFGHSSFKGIDLVAGGLYGKYGDIILDKISKPSQIVGIADGQGGILKGKIPSKFQRKIKIINQLLTKNKSMN